MTNLQKNDIPELFREALSSLNNVPLHKDLFICHTWVSKPTSDNNKSPRPACWIISAPAMEGAIECSHAIRSILDYLFIESTAKRITTEDVSIVIAHLNQRVKLLLPEDAALIFSDLNHSIIMTENKIDDLVISPFTKEAGFRIFTINEYSQMVPTN